GTLNIAPTSGTFSGGAIINNALLSVNANATLTTLSGAGTLSVASGKSLSATTVTTGAVVNDGSLTLNGNSTTGKITGTGTTSVATGKTLTASAVLQSALNINGTGVTVIPPA